MQLLLLINVTPVDTLFYCVQGICRHTLPTTNIFALKIDGWKMKCLPFGASSADFQGKELLVLGRVFFDKQVTCGISLLGGN